MESIAKIPEYTPESVPERGDRVPSFRDDVRRTIARHNFRPSTTHYTRQADIYQLFRSDNNHREDTPVLEEKFRSALGRVLRPPSSANAFAKSFAVPNISRWHEYISMVSMDCPCIELKSFIKSSKREEGLRRRKAASANDHIGRLREARRERKLNGSTSNCDNIAQEQHVSFRYVDELLTLNCAEDLLKLKVCFFFCFSLLLSLSLCLLLGFLKTRGPFLLLILILTILVYRHTRYVVIANERTDFPKWQGMYVFIN